jgi:hypothetical protein
MFAALQVEELHTDASMENFTIFDIQSENDEDSDNDDHGGCPSKAKEKKDRKKNKPKCKTDVSNLANI